VDTLRVALQIILMKRSWCLKVSGAVAPSAPKRIYAIIFDLSRIIIADNKS